MKTYQKIKKISQHKKQYFNNRQKDLFFDNTIVTSQSVERKVDSPFVGLILEKRGKRIDAKRN